MTTLLLAPAPMAPIPDLMNNLGGQVLATAQGLAPLAVPFVLAMTAIGWVMHKFGVGGRLELMQLDRQAAYDDGVRAAKAERRAANKQRRYDSMRDDANTENRRRNLRKRFTGSYSRESDF